ncbi:MAG: hypothetical protein ACR652_12950 [Methylocystis sp.]|uniref:hypothetical protein n=1 Tax=Methylocystis sp. TaxID=1911079 RepID=UPI003DA574FF
MSHIEGRRGTTALLLTETVQTQAGAIGGAHVAVGPAVHRPPLHTRAFRSVQSFGRSAGGVIASGYRSLRDAVGARVGGHHANNHIYIETPVVPEILRTPAEVRAALSAQLPPTVTVSETGEISGKWETNGLAKGSPLAQEKSKSFAEVLLANPPKNEKAYGDIKISGQAQSDFYRMNYTIRNGEKTFNSIRDLEGKTDQAERNESVANHLHGLTQNREATFVLSNILTQQLGSFISYGYEDNNKNAVNFSPLGQGQGKTGIDLFFRQPGGEEIAVAPKAMGGMEFNIFKEGDDFKVDVDWEYFASKAGMEDLEGMDGSLLKINAHMTMTIDGLSANQGVLAFKEEPRATMDFHGQMATQYSS